MKRILALLLTLTMLLSLAACGAADTEQAEPVDTAPVQDTVPTAADETPEYPMNFTGYYTDDSEIISLAKSFLRDSTVLLSDSQEGQQKIDAMENRIAEIESTSTSIVKADTYVQGVSYCGTAYYVDAENGNDENDGLSPETAFRTAGQIDGIAMNLREGDAVFFKRGCIYYDACPTIVSGVTYSAYGEGAKPILTPSSNGGNDPANWVLYYEEGEQKIWHYQKTDFASVGWIDFNCSNDLYAYPVYEYWSPETGYQYIENVYADYDEVADGGYSRNRYGELISKEIHEMLTEDLTFVSRTDYKDSAGNWCSGTNLYLRCDEGNPAEVFDVIKFTAITYNQFGDPLPGPVQAVEATNATLDNLELSNGAQWGVGGMDHSTIQNCEVSFIGNTVWFYDEWKPSESNYLSVYYIGDGIYCCVDGMTVRNNYVHHCCCVGITGELYGESADLVLDEWIVDSNVVAYCGTSYIFQDGNGWVNLEMEGISVSDNYFAYAGQCEGILRWYNDFNGISIYGWDDTGTSDVYKFLASKQHFTGNTIIGGYDSSFNSVVDGFNAIATFTGNTFVGDPMDNAVMILNMQKVIKYWQLCE
ncbi:MAG: hypothetical protein IKT52_00795 [Oscillospiraceae bacterium]|nr:hypothetical protein [Oscillospiraceae bacterium]